MRLILVSLVPLGLLACNPSYSYGGYKIFEHFPMDGHRSWEYASDDVSIEHKLEVRMNDEPIQVGDTLIHEFQHFNQATGEMLGAVQWSSDSVDGVMIHGYQTTGPSGEVVNFDDPVVFADASMAPDESVTSSAGGWDFTSTFESVEGCANHWVGDDWDSCLRFHLDDGDGDDATGAIFAGDYWLVPRYGIAWQATSGDSDTWVLVKADWEPAE
jgi:hypothetical protein